MIKEKIQLTNLIQCAILTDEETSFPNYCYPELTVLGNNSLRFEYTCTNPKIPSKEVKCNHQLENPEAQNNYLCLYHYMKDLKAK